METATHSATHRSNRANENLGSSAARGTFVSGAGTTASPWLISAKPKVYTTATRPSAVTLGDGAMIYDTTINKPIWSDGAVWRDATGTAARE